MAITTEKIMSIAKFLYKNNSHTLLIDVVNFAAFYFPYNENIALLRAKVHAVNGHKKIAIDSLISWQMNNFLSHRLMNLIVSIENDTYSIDSQKYAYWSILLNPSKDLGISQLLAFFHGKKELQKQVKLLSWLSIFFSPDDSRFSILLRKAFQNDRDTFFDLLNDFIDKQPSQPWLRYYRALLGTIFDNKQTIDQDIQFLQKDPRNHFLSKSISCIRTFSDSKLKVFDQRIDLFKYALKVVEYNRKKSDDLLLEFGVYKGKSTRMICSLISGELHAFDSFRGLPEAWENEPAGSYSNSGQIPHLPENVVVHKGLFSETLSIFKLRYHQKVAFIHVDCDLYSSTSEIFRYLGDRLQVGTVIVFDEYFGYPGFEHHECRAFEEFIQRGDREMRGLAIGPFTNQLAIQIL